MCLRTMAGIEMSEARLLNISGRYRTFLTKRFDRQDGMRIHFASAMTMTGNSEETIKDQPVSYLDLAEFIQNYGRNIAGDLAQLWKRIVFNLMTSNTDDHLRNHGFLLDDNGWRLSPAYDLNPSIDKDHLALNIDTENNSLDMELARSVGEFFGLNNQSMDATIDEVRCACVQWQDVAKELKIPRSEQELMAPAFAIAGV